MLTYGNKGKLSPYRCSSKGDSHNDPIIIFFLFSLTSLSSFDEPIRRWGETGVPRENHLTHPQCFSTPLKFDKTVVKMHEKGKGGNFFSTCWNKVTYGKKQHWEKFF